MEFLKCNQTRQETLLCCYLVQNNVMSKYYSLHLHYDSLIVRWLVKLAAIQCIFLQHKDTWKRGQKNRSERSNDHSQSKCMHQTNNLLQTQNLCFNTGQCSLLDSFQCEIAGFLKLTHCVPNIKIYEKKNRCIYV